MAAYEHSIECIRLPDVPIRLDTNYALHVQTEEHVMKTLRSDKGIYVNN